MTHDTRCLAIGGLAGLAAAAVLLSPVAVRFGLAAGSWVADRLAERIEVR